MIDKGFAICLSVKPTDAGSGSARDNPSSPLAEASDVAPIGSQEPVVGRLKFGLLWIASRRVHLSTGSVATVGVSGCAELRSNEAMGSRWDSTVDRRLRIILRIPLHGLSGVGSQDKSDQLQRLVQPRRDSATRQPVAVEAKAWMAAGDFT